MAQKTSKTGASTRGEERRDEIIDHALRVAAVEGLEALSIGRLAKELKMSKSGLFIHFGSKAQLEKEVVERAHTLFFNRVLLPSEDRTPGIERLWALCDYWLEFVERPVLPGGYFFTGAFFERAEQKGRIAERVRDIAEEWFRTLADVVDQARRRDEIRSEVDAKGTAYEVNCVLIGAHLSILLRQKHQSNARMAILGKLGSLATEEVPPEAFESVKDWNSYLNDRHGWKS